MQNQLHCCPEKTVQNPKMLLKKFYGQVSLKNPVTNTCLSWRVVISHEHSKGLKKSCNNLLPFTMESFLGVKSINSNSLKNSRATEELQTSLILRARFENCKDEETDAKDTKRRQ